MRHSPSVPSPGQIARLRQRLYLVEQIVPGKRSGDSTLVRMSCVDDDNQGRPLEVLWERELDPEILTGESWECIAQRGFDEPTLFQAYLKTLTWNCVTATDPRMFQSPFRAGIRLDAYQLEPLRKALLLPRVNLFIADDVGLGKTIEAGLIARELLLRKKVREIVVSCPPSMLYQWQDELESRFGLTFAILDKDYMKSVRRERGFGANPWSTHSRFLISHRLLIDESYAGPLRDWLGAFRSSTLLILDEAHHAAPASGRKYAIDSQITRAVRDVAPRFEHRLFLSATPHNGHSNSFSALLEILDPQRFCRGVSVTAKHRDEVIVRRLKDDVREIQGGFPKRKVVQIDIDGLPEDAPELRLSALLDEYRELREQRLKGESKRKQAAAALLITGLQQRLLSSVEAFARTLHVHRKTVLRQWEDSQGATDVKETEPISLDLLSGTVGSDDDRATLSEEDLQAEEDLQIEEASALSLGPIRDATAKELFSREQDLLSEMAELADHSRGQPDARVNKLIEWIRENMVPELGKTGATWNTTRVIIFTEYDDTKRYLKQQLEAAIARTERADERIEVYHGPTPPAKREEIKRAFNANPSKHPVRILIATDAAREGLNLQAHCWNLFHFDVPWNPSRMEQRNGRIDRKLQPRNEVYCHYFVYSQRPEDRILQVLVKKTETIRNELGSLSQVIDSRLAKTLSQGIRRKTVNDLQREIESTDLATDRRATVEEELESARERQLDLRQQIERLRNLLDSSQKTIGLDEEQFRSAISCALELVGSEPLHPVEHSEDGNGKGRFTFPALDQRHGADPTWAETMDTLRVPRKRDERPWDWRRTAPIRPVVFEDQGTVDDETVHLHLEHRIVQRLLGRFTAQGFVHHELSRACLAQTHDAIPRVALLGRLCLYGPGAARLHEELIPVTARWTDPQIRKGPLSPYAREAEQKTLQLLENSLKSSRGHHVSEQVSKQLVASAAQDVRELLPHLQSRGEEYAGDAEAKLRQRAESEAKAMRDILETQKKHIGSTVAKHAKMDRQMVLDLGFPEEEFRQLEADKRYWDKRLTMIEEELKTEPERIRGIYEVKAKRIEPVGLVYLWPVTG
ncbi:MAG: DISARM system SNF2-like helicase DrmD [Pseudomonadota bacterium]